MRSSYHLVRRAAWHDAGDKTDDALAGTRTMVTIENIRKLALALPGAFERPTYADRPSWRTKPRMFAWIREDPEALVVWVASLEEKEALLASDRTKFSTTPHYAGNPVVLVDLDAVDAAEAAELVTDSWRLRAPRRLVAARDAEGGPVAESDAPENP